MFFLFWGRYYVFLCLGSGARRHHHLAIPFSLGSKRRGHERTHVVQSALTRQCHNQPVSCWKGPRVPSVFVEKAADPSTVLPRYGAGYQHRRPNRATKPGTTRNIDGHRMLIPEIAWFSVYGCFTKGLLYIVRFLLTLLSPTVDGII